MPELRFTLRLNTPAFLGSVQRGTKQISRVAQGRTSTKAVPYYPADPAGIRVPTLRGILAFWLRSTLGNLDSQAIYEHQGAVFGSTEVGQGLRIRNVGKASFDTDELAIRDRDRRSGFLYLGYGPLQLLKVPDRHIHGRSHTVVSSYNWEACRDVVLALEDETRPTFRFQAQGNTEQIQALKQALRLLHLFGGIGGRSRRGWGSVAVEKPAGLIAQRRRGEAAGIYLSRLLGQALEGVHLPQNRPRFSAFSRATRVHILETASETFDDALWAFYKRFRDTRLYRTRNGTRQDGIPREDHDLEASSSENAQTPLTEAPARLAFGLPYHPKGSGWDIEYFGHGDAGARTRRASPLLLKVLRLGEEEYYPVALFLDSELFGDPSARIKAKVPPEGTLKKGEAPPPDSRAIREFLEPWQQVPLPRGPLEVS